MADKVAKLPFIVNNIITNQGVTPFTLRYACVRSLRRTFYDWAFTSLTKSSWARAYYDYHKAKNQSHSTILRNLGKKWIKILFAVWLNGTSYDEALHIQNLKARNVPWAMAL